MIKIIFATFRVWSGVPGSPADYMIEANLYTSRWTYDDPTCPPSGPPIGLQGEETYDEASVRIAIPDYVGQGLTGCKTFAPAMFPRQTYEIDYIQGLWKTDLMSQTNLNGQTGTVEIGRGEIITDRTGWKCDNALADNAVFRQWNVGVTFVGARYDMAFAVPDDRRFLCPNEMPTLGGEFLANAGTFQVFYWDFEFQREGSTAWEPVEEWTVIRDDHLPGSLYGVRVVPFGGRYALELSNAGGLPSYLALGASFTIPRGKPALEIALHADTVRLTWPANFTGLQLEHTASVSTPDWLPVTNAVSVVVARKRSLRTPHET